MNVETQHAIKAVIDSVRDRHGDLSDEGQSLSESLAFALRNPGFDDAVKAQANRVKSQAECLRKAGRVPVIYREHRA